MTQKLQKIAKIVYNALVHKKNPSYRKRDLEVPNTSIRKAIWNTGGTLV